MRNQLTIGVLLDSISEEHVGDRQATIKELLRVAAVGVDLFYTVISHRDFTPEVLEEARAYWGPLVDVARQECGLGPAAIRARVDALCTELAQLLATTSMFPPSANWWPANLGVPSGAGGQNTARYAIFPSTRRLAIQINGVTKVFDTGEHRIGGVQQQQQGGGYGSVTFTSQFGTFDVSSLPEVGTQRAAETPGAARAPQYQSQYQSDPAQAQYQSDPAPQFAPQTQTPEPASSASGDPAAIVAAIESLAGLHQRGILSDEEFAAKKAELLGRL